MEIPKPVTRHVLSSSRGTLFKPIHISLIDLPPNGFDQCYNAQIAVNDDMLIVGNYANAHHNDKQEFLPTIESVPDELEPQITSAVADTGYYSQQNIENCPQNITPIIAKSKEKHNSYIEQLLTQQMISIKRFIERGNIR